MYFTSKFLYNNSVELWACYDSYTLSTYALINEFSGVIFHVFKALNWYVPKPIMVDMDTFKGPSPSYMIFLEKYILTLRMLMYL